MRDVHVIGYEGGSDSEDGDICGKKTGRGMIDRNSERTGGICFNCRGEIGWMGWKRKIGAFACGGCRHDLSGFICAEFRPATSHLFHLCAVALQ